MSAQKRCLPLDSGEPRKLLLPLRKSRAAVDLAETAEVTLVVRSRGSHEAWDALVAETTSGLPGQRRYLTRAEFAKHWAASPEDIEAVRRFAESQRLEVVETDAFRRCVVLAGSLQHLQRAFNVDFHAVSHPSGTFRSHRGVPQLPASVHPIVEAVIGLDNVPSTQPHAAADVSRGGMDREALLKAYDIPPHLRGAGQCMAAIDLGGGYHRSDYNAYFRKLGLEPPRLRTRQLRGVTNDPAPKDLIAKFSSALGASHESAPPMSDPQEFSWVMWTIETTTDICILGTLAPDATILLVQSTNDDQGQYHAITSVIADSRNAPSVLSCSWGGVESTMTPGLMRVVNWWFQAAAVLGITVFCSSGDSGDGTLHATSSAQLQLTTQFPASSPYVLACGGTTLHPTRRTEVAWKQKRGSWEMASGGGFSEVFPLPDWQRDAGIDVQHWVPSGAQSGSGRAVPDVAAKANLDARYSIIVGGIEFPACGTSSAAPLWAGLTALLNEGLQTRTGSLHHLLYDGTLKPGIRDIVSGNTGTFCACKGWDACTGWGSPRGEVLLKVLKGEHVKRPRAH